MGQEAQQQDGGDGGTSLPGVDAVFLPPLPPPPAPLPLPPAHRISNDHASWSTYLAAVSSNESSSGGGGVSQVAAAGMTVPCHVSPLAMRDPGTSPFATTLPGSGNGRTGSCELEDALMAAMDLTLLDSPPSSPRASGAVSGVCGRSAPLEADPAAQGDPAADDKETTATAGLDNAVAVGIVASGDDDATRLWALPSAQERRRLQQLQQQERGGRREPSFDSMLPLPRGRQRTFSGSGLSVVCEAGSSGQGHRRGGGRRRLREQQQRQDRHDGSSNGVVGYPAFSSSSGASDSVASADSGRLPSNFSELHSAAFRPPPESKPHNAAAAAAILKRSEAASPTRSAGVSPPLWAGSEEPAARSDEAAADCWSEVALGSSLYATPRMPSSPPAVPDARPSAATAAARSNSVTARSSDGVQLTSGLCSGPVRGRLAKAVSLPLLMHMAAARYDGVQSRTAAMYSSVPHSAAARYRSTSISGGCCSPLSSPTPLSPLRPRRAGTYSGTDSPSSLQGRPRSPPSAVPKVLHPLQLQLPPLPGITRQDELLLMTSLRSMSDAMSTAASSSRASSGGGHHDATTAAASAYLSSSAGGHRDAAAAVSSSWASSGGGHRDAAAAASAYLSSSAGGHRDATAAVSSSWASSGGGHRDSITAAVEAPAPPPAYRDDTYPVSEEEDEGEGCTVTVTPAATAAAHGGSDIGVRVPVAKPPTTVAAEAESSQLAVSVSTEATSTLFTLSASVDALTAFVSELTTAVGDVSGQLAGVRPLLTEASPHQGERQQPEWVWGMTEGGRGGGNGGRSGAEEGDATAAAAAMAAWPSSFASVDAAALAALRFSEYEDGGDSFLDAAAAVAFPRSDPAVVSLALSLDAGMLRLPPRLPPQRARRRRTGGDGTSSPPLLSRSNDSGGGSSGGGRVISAASGRRRAEALLRRHPLLGQALCVTVAGLVGGTLAHASLAPEPDGSRLTRLE